MSKQTEFHIMGYCAYPTRRNYPKPGTQAETEWLKGWNEAKNSENNSSDVEWPFGRDTFAANY